MRVTDLRLYHSNWNMRRDLRSAREVLRISFVFPARKLPLRSSFFNLGNFFEFARARAPASRTSFHPSCNFSRLGKLGEFAKATVPSSAKKLCFRIKVLSFGRGGV